MKMAVSPGYRLTHADYTETMESGPRPLTMRSFQLAFCFRERGKEKEYILILFRFQFIWVRNSLNSTLG